MRQSLIFLAGMATMALLAFAWSVVGGGQRALPAGTARQLRRARRDQRLELDVPPRRWVREARDNFEDLEDLTR